jgi:sarcosine oxidase subunit alpha
VGRIVRRLESVAGEWIDRTRPIDFVFEGQKYRGYEGDTLVSALLANGESVLGRSFKYHRPRGVASAANHDVNALFQLRSGGRSVPNVRGDTESLRPGMRISAVNTVGGLARDRLAVVDRLSRFLPVGFYYKAFLNKKSFPKWEQRIRAAAGLGRVDDNAARVMTSKRYAHTDVLVIGAGVSGLAAAVEAAERGAKVLLVEESPRIGGSALYARGGAAVALRVEELIATVSGHARIQVLTSAFAAGYYADHWISVVTPSHLVKVRAKAVVVAQGVFEQPAVFRGNDLPGVMLASGAQRLMYRYGVAPASRIAVLTANEEGYVAALDAIARGIRVAAVLDLRSAPHPSEEGGVADVAHVAGAAAGGVTGSRGVVAAVRGKGVDVQFGVRPVEAVAAAGRRVARFEFEAPAGSQRHRLEVDGLWMSVGFAPANQLLHQAGAKMRFDADLQQFVPATMPAGVFACGRVAGWFTLDGRLRSGQEAGLAAASHAAASALLPSPTSSRAAETASAVSGAAAGFAAARTQSAENQVSSGAAAEQIRSTPTNERGTPTHAYPVFPHPKGKEFVDLDEDLVIADLANAFQEGFDSSELLKRYSTVGMGPSQGKHSNMNAVRILAKLRGEDVGKVGTTTARPMFHPVPLAHLSGRGFYPQRRTALHAEHEKLKAIWMPAGDWQRPEYYARANESREASIQSEVRAVREAVGIIDVGTLGKIEAHGAGAGEFLDRVYAGQYTTLKPGMTRYGLLLDEAGVIVDDGVIARLGPEHFYFTTTTGNSGSLFRELGRLATWWRMPVGLVNLTGHFAAFNVAGPHARAVLRKLTSLDLSHNAFPYLAVREAEVAGVRCRLMRVGFVGEIGYEIHLPVSHAVTVWQAVLDAGKPFGIRPFGVEAQRILRLEKGHIIVGQDTDGLTNPLEIGARWALRMNKPFFVGQRSLQILDKKPLRQTLVGFRLPAAPLPIKESHLIIEAGRIAGRVTSVVKSPTLNAIIGLALVEPAVAERGTLQIRIGKDQHVQADIVALPFYDEPGERQRIEEAA